MSHTETGASSALPVRPDRDLLSGVALAAAAISLLGFAVLGIGHLVDPSVFNNTKHPGAADFVAFYAYVLGLLIALLLGGATWLYGRRAHSPKPRAKIAACYGILFLIIGIVIAALGG